VERVRWIVTVEDDLAARECPAAGDRKKPADILRREIGEERRFHADSLCNGGDIRNVAYANDAAPRRAYSRVMTDRTREEHHMKRIATIGAIITAFAVAPSVASGGNVSAQFKSQVIGVQTAKAQRATVAVSVQRHLVLIARAERFARIRAQIR